MNLWFAAGVVFLCGIGICAYVICRAPQLTDSLVGIQMAGTLAVLTLLIMSIAMQRPSFIDLALALALVALPGTAVYSYFIERWFP